MESEKSNKTVGGSKYRKDSKKRGASTGGGLGKKGKKIGNFRGRLRGTKGPSSR